MDANELKTFLEENKADIAEAIKRDVIARILDSHRWDISDQITAVVREFVGGEVVPEVKKYLADQKGPILEAALAGAAGIGDAIAKGMAEHVAKNITHDSWKLRQVMKALFE